MEPFGIVGQTSLVVDGISNTSSSLGFNQTTDKTEFIPNYEYWGDSYKKPYDDKTYYWAEKLKETNKANSYQQTMTKKVKTISHNFNVYKEKRVLNPAIVFLFVKDANGKTIQSHGKYLMQIVELRGQDPYLIERVRGQFKTQRKHYFKEIPSNYPVINTGEFVYLDCGTVGGRSNSPIEWYANCSLELKEQPEHWSDYEALLCVGTLDWQNAINRGIAEEKAGQLYKEKQEKNRINYELPLDVSITLGQIQLRPHKEGFFYDAAGFLIPEPEIEVGNFI